MEERRKRTERTRRCCQRKDIVDGLLSEEILLP